MNNPGKALSDLEKLKSRVLYLAGLTAAKDANITERDQKLAIYKELSMNLGKKLTNYSVGMKHLFSMTMPF